MGVNQLTKVSTGLHIAAAGWKLCDPDKFILNQNPV